MIIEVGRELGESFNRNQRNIWFMEEGFVSYMCHRGQERSGMESGCWIWHLRGN